LIARARHIGSRQHEAEERQDFASDAGANNDPFADMQRDAVLVLDVNLIRDSSRQTSAKHGRA
jgi:hypothetical protein